MPLYYKKIKLLHGHLGPYVVTGYLMGIYVKGYLDRIESVDAYLRHAPPVSCILDGLQLSTGCTLGRHNIKIKRSQWFNKAVFSQGKKKITVKLSENLQKKLHTSLPAALKYVNKTPKKELFVIN